MRSQFQIGCHNVALIFLHILSFFYVAFFYISFVPFFFTFVHVMYYLHFDSFSLYLHFIVALFLSYLYVMIFFSLSFSSFLPLHRFSAFILQSNISSDIFSALLTLQFVCLPLFPLQKKQSIFLFFHGLTILGWSKSNTLFYIHSLIILFAKLYILKRRDFGVSHEELCFLFHWKCSCFFYLFTDNFFPEMFQKILIALTFCNIWINFILNLTKKVNE